MAFTYDSPAASEKDAVRFLLGDTTDDGHLLEDEEIDWLISKWKPVHGTTEYVAATAAETIAAKFAREANYSADGVSISLAQLGQQFRELAAQLREQHKSLLVGGTPDVGGITPGEQPDPNILPLDFGTGMHDNPEAGRQAYGQRDYIQGYYDPYTMPGV
jgi:hypothetical protein